MKKKIFLLGFILVMAFTLGCRREVPHLILATTTSVENSGLLDALIPVFEKEAEARVDVIACGTGKAIRLAENGDCDLILVHDPEAEERFVKEGYGVNRKSIMYNDFVIVGPEDDPAKIKGIGGVIPALSTIAHKKAPFISRGDDSGTHKREKQLWEKAGLIPGGEWYQETGQGMGATLVIASQKRAYCLTDRATYLSYKDKFSLISLYEKDNLLYNPYSVILVNPEKFLHTNYRWGIEFINFLISDKGKKIIREFGKAEFGEPLFHPMGE
ncbi:substrate-binding domain-containing protein [bacterium]|nr:substrate-binding domain-containing protein [bacterium]